MTKKKYQRTNEAHTCLYCGKPMRYDTYYNASVRGFRGQGFFCTMVCGWRFALAFARDGQRLEPGTPEEAA